MPKTIRIAGINFNANFLKAYMKNIFGESFAHSSLSFEKVFTEGKDYAQQLATFISPENTEYADKLEKGNQEDLSLLKQRFEEIAFALQRFGVPKERIQLSETEFTPCIDDFTMYFKGAVRPYRNTQELKKAESDKKLTGAKYETETVLERVQLLFKLITEKIKADNTACELKKGNNTAFSYALSLPAIGVKEIIEINGMVNNESGIHKGFKSTDNDIIGAPFTPCPKELVPIKMQELVHKYNNEWAREIAPFIEGIHSTEQKNEHLRAVCEREAKYHIEFERIHPFEDGNGRTGRIILNANLIANELAPILITPEMHDMYIKCIDDNDYKTLGQYIFMLSSVCLTEMVAYYRKVKGIDPNEPRLIFKPITIPQSGRVQLDELQQLETPPEDEDIKIYNFKRSKTSV